MGCGVPPMRGSNPLAVFLGALEKWQFPVQWSKKEGNSGSLKKPAQIDRKNNPKRRFSFQILQNSMLTKISTTELRAQVLYYRTFCNSQASFSRFNSTSFHPTQIQKIRVIHKPIFFGSINKKRKKVEKKKRGKEKGEVIEEGLLDS